MMSRSYVSRVAAGLAAGIRDFLAYSALREGEYTQPDASTYVVRPGDTLGSIAQRFCTTPTAARFLLDAPPDDPGRQQTPDRHWPWGGEVLAHQPSDQPDKQPEHAPHHDQAKGGAAASLPSHLPGDNGRPNRDTGRRNQPPSRGARHVGHDHGDHESKEPNPVMGAARCLLRLGVGESRRGLPGVRECYAPGRRSGEAAHRGAGAVGGCAVPGELAGSAIRGARRHGISACSNRQMVGSIPRSGVISPQNKGGVR